MKKNVASQSIGVQMVSATDGSAFTGAVTVYVTGDAGTQAIGSVGFGACTHEGNGFHTYAPAQAETNYDHIGFTFIGTGAVPATVQVFTNFPQTGDNFARLGAPAGASVSADVAAVKSDSAAILVDTAEIGAAGAGLTNIGTIATVTNLTNLPAAAALEATLTAMKGATFSGATDSLEALRDRGDAAWATATGFATPTNITAASGVTLAATTGLGNQTANITGNLSGSVGSVTGAVGSVTGAVGSVTGAVGSVTATVSANVVSISGSTAAADNLEESTEVIGYGTCTTGGSTTTVVASAISPTSAVNDQYNGRVIIFKGNTTAALAGQATTISDYDHATLTFTVVALTTAPASGDLFTIL